MRILEPLEQVDHRSEICESLWRFWSGRPDSNRRHPAWKAGTLPLSYSRSKEVLEAFIGYRKATKGLTESGEKWLRNTLNTFMNCLTLPLEEIQQEHLIDFLAVYEDRPWRRHSFYRALRTFFKWFSRIHDLPNPMLDKWGNLIIEAPKTPSKVLYTITPENVQKLIDATDLLRNKALISLLADSGARRVVRWTPKFGQVAKRESRS